MADMYFDIVYKYVCENNYLYVQKILDDHGDEIDINNEKEGHQLIHIACANNSLEIVQLLIDRGSDLNNLSLSSFEQKKLIKGKPLEIAFRNKNITIARAIIEAGLKKNKNFITNSYSDAQGVLIEALRDHNYSIDVIKLMIEYGADVNEAIDDVVIYVDEQQGWTPLMFACEDMREDIVKVLIEAGADVNAVSECGDTAESILFENKKAYGHISFPTFKITYKKQYRNYTVVPLTDTYMKEVRDYTLKKREHFAKCDRIAEMIKDERVRLMKEKRNARRLELLGKRPYDSDGISKIGGELLGEVASYIDPSGNRPKLKE